MKVVEYDPMFAKPLALALDRAREGPLMRSAAYLNHLYLEHPRRRLYLLLSDDGDVIATLGSERVALRIGSERTEVAIGSNTYSLKAGAFPFLLHHWMRTCEVGVMIPGTASWNAILARQAKWQKMSGLRTYILNWGYPTLDVDPFWKKMLKPSLRVATRIDPETFSRAIAKTRGSELTVAEERGFSADMLDRSGAFGLRLDADIDYLNWRFRTNLDYVKYRVFRILGGSATRGYVVLADWPHCLIVSHCDGDDPEELALGVLIAVASVNRGERRYRQVVLTSMHSVMRSVFQEFGFRPKPGDTPFYMAAFGNHHVPPEAGSDWLVNMELGDHGATMGMLDRNSLLRQRVQTQSGA